MTGWNRLLPVAALVLFAAFPCAVNAQGRVERFYPQSRQPAATRAAEASPLQDDANLHDVQFIGTGTGFAVGDHGVIWKTSDAGRSWRLLKSPVTCPLRSVCFLTDRIGWIAGGGTAAYTRIGYGVVLQTQDGGETWQVFAGRRHARPGAMHTRPGPTQRQLQQEPRNRPSRTIPKPKRQPPRPAVNGPGHSLSGPGFSSVPPEQLTSRRSTTGVERRRNLSRGLPGDQSQRGTLPSVSNQRPRRSGSSLPVAIPSLKFIKFFSLQQGVAVGEASDDFPSGVLLTSDGGRSWKPVQGKRLPGWRAADFMNPSVGVVAGLYGKVRLVGGGRMLTPAIDDTGLRGVRAVKLNRDETGWLVGEGGLVLKTENGGVLWKVPPKPLPREVRDMADFSSVAVVKDRVWIAGSPGSVIWHSANGGRTWSRQLTGQTVPIHALHFVNERVGWAVGALGTILFTGDGGETWYPVRGKNRRAAFLAVHTRPRNVTFPLLAKLAGDEGYRGTVLVTARSDYGPDGPTGTAHDEQLANAVTTAGGSAAVANWRFPVALPGLDGDEQRLWKDWNRRAEGRLREVMLGSLVSQIRTWRPNVVVLDHTPKDDALGKLVNEAVLQAIRQAGDSTYFIRQSELAGLSPWKVSKVYVRLADGSAGDAYISPHEHLPHVGEVAHVAATKAETKLRKASRQTAKRQAFRLIYDRTAPPHAPPYQGGARGGRRNRGDFFKGLNLWPGGEARRKLAPIDESEYEKQLALARRQRNFQAIAERTLDDQRVAAQMIAQLSRITEGMDHERAATQLLKLADDYRRRSQWELAEATWIEAVAQFPNANASLVAMQNLFHLWSGAEPVWHRVREVASVRSRLTTDLTTLNTRLQRAVQLARLPAAYRNVEGLNLGPDPAKLLTMPHDHHLDRNAQRQQKGVQHWQSQAVRMAELLRKRDPELYLSPQIQFSLAALLRTRGGVHTAQRALQEFQKKSSGNVWKQTADGEMWLIAPRGEPPKTVGVCRKAEERPTLDGILSDRCWESAKVIWLTPTIESGDELRERSFVLMTYDSEYLYIAANVPNVIAPPGSDAKMSSRVRDADLSKFDRVSIHLDLDRDYATYYTLTVDQRGWTAESCWGDITWNPKWHVAADKDKQSWRFEVAIPWRELSPAPPLKRSVCAVGITRIAPAVGMQSWTHPAGKTPKPETFGLLRFD